MTLREGPYRAVRDDSGERNGWWIHTRAQSRAEFWPDGDLPALRRLLERLEGREKPKRKGPPYWQTLRCEACGGKAPGQGFQYTEDDVRLCPKCYESAAQPTKGKRRRAGGKR